MIGGPAATRYRNRWFADDGENKDLSISVKILWYKVIYLRWLADVGDLS